MERIPQMAYNHIVRVGGQIDPAFLGRSQASFMSTLLDSVITTTHRAVPANHPSLHPLLFSLLPFLFASFCNSMDGTQGLAYAR